MTFKEFNIKMTRDPILSRLLPLQLRRSYPRLQLRDGELTASFVGFKIQAADGAVSAFSPAYYLRVSYPRCSLLSFEKLSAEGAAKPMQPHSPEEIRQLAKLCDNVLRLYDEQSEKLAETMDACNELLEKVLEPEQLKQLRRGMFVSVVGRRRLSSTVANLMQNYGCLPDPYAALAHSGLHDYRATAGEGRTILVLSEESPAYSLEFLSSCLGISPGELKNRMEQT